MKKYSFLFAPAFIISCLLYAFSAYGNDNDDKELPDPAGTVTTNISRSSRITLNDCEVYWTAPNNIRVYGSTPACEISICTVWQVKGLAGIVKIPASGFTPSTIHSNSALSCAPGCGYVIKIQEKIYQTGVGYINGAVTYARMYVAESVVNIYDEIIGARVKYQYPWNP